MIHVSKYLRDESSWLHLSDWAPDDLMLYLLNALIVLQPQDLRFQVACKRTHN